MDDRLSQRERRILAEIEQALSRDDPLDRSLRTMRRSRRSPGLAAVGVALLGVATVVLLVTAVATAEPALVWAFAAAWVVTLVCLMRLAMSWSGRRLAARAARGRDAGRQKDGSEGGPSASA